MSSTDKPAVAIGRGWKLLVRLGIALAMTVEYGGRFPRRKMFPFYWQQAGRMVRERG